MTDPTNNALLARIKELEEALLPMSELADAILSEAPSVANHYTIILSISYDIQLEDLRNVQKALRK